MNRRIWQYGRWALVVTLILTAGAFFLSGRADPPAPTIKVGEPADASKPAELPKDRRVLLETIGALNASHSYQTYLNIGMIADAKAKGVYSEKDAYKLLDSVLSLLDSVDGKMSELAKLEFDAGDRDTLEQMRKLSKLLREQGKALQTAWDTGRDDDAVKYENIRKDSWTAISKLLGLSK
ncbi:MAG TPA: hypothetical protein VGZ47_12785 [Gemmataceae bacterium]|jgi:hypothetical protein|nr:hypothetical protein [Gemmataceae bacterium]